MDRSGVDQLLGSVLAADHRSPTRPSDKVLLVKGVGGLGNRLFALLQAIAYAHVTGRRLLVDWRDDHYANAGENAFFSLFSSPLVEREIQLSPRLSVAPRIWTGRLDHTVWQLRDEDRLQPLGIRGLTRALAIDVSTSDYTEDVLVFYDWSFHPRKLARYWDVSRARRPEFVRALLQAAVQVLPPLEARAESFAREHFRRPTIGVHIRASDNMRYALKRVNLGGYAGAVASLRRAHPEAQLFLSTDNRDILRAYQAQDPTLVHLDKFLPTRAGAPLHKACDGIDRRTVAEEAVVDLCLLGMTDYLVHSRRSSFSRVADLCSRRPERRVIDVDRASIQLALSHLALALRHGAEDLGRALLKRVR